MKINQTKNQKSYIHKTTPIPKRSRQFCHSSSNNITEIQDDAKSVFGSSKRRPNSSTSTPMTINITQQFDRQKHSLCTFNTHEFNFPKMSTPFSTCPMSNNETTESTISKSTSCKSMPVSNATSIPAVSRSPIKQDILKNSKLPVASRKHFSALLNSPPVKSSGLFASSSFKANVGESAPKFSPFKTPRRRSDHFNKHTNGFKTTDNNSNLSDCGIPESSKRRSFIAYQKHILRMSKSDRKSLDSSIGNVYKCRYEPSKCTTAMLDDARDFLNSAQSLKNSELLCSTNMITSTCNGPINVEKTHNLTSYLTPSKLKHSNSTISYFQDDRKRLVTPSISKISEVSYDTKYTEEEEEESPSLKNAPIENVNVFFNSIQNEANQSNVPKIREELTSKLLHDSSLSLVEPTPLLSVSSFTRRSKSKNLSKSLMNESNLNNCSHELLFGVIKNSLISFEVALKFIIGLSANFYNCYNDISRAGDDSILAIENSMINNIKLMDVIPNNLVDKFLNFGKCCSTVIDKSDNADNLSTASLRNMADYFNYEPSFDDCKFSAITTNDNTINTTNTPNITHSQPQHLYRSNVMSPIVKKTHTSTPNHRATNKTTNYSNLSRLSAINKEHLYTNNSNLKSSTDKQPKKHGLLRKKTNVVVSKNLSNEKPQFKLSKSTLKTNSKQFSIIHPDNNLDVAPKHNPNANPITNNLSKPGYHCTSSRRLSSRRSSLFFQNPSDMSNNIVEKVEVDGSNKHTDIVADIIVTASIKPDDMVAVVDSNSRKRKGHTSGNSNSISRSDNANSNTKLAPKVKSSDIDEELIESIATVDIIEEDQSVDKRRRSTRTKSKPQDIIKKDDSVKKRAVKKTTRGRPAKTETEKLMKATTSTKEKSAKKTTRGRPPKAETKAKHTESTSSTTKKTATSTIKTKKSTTQKTGKVSARQTRRKP